MTLLLACTGGVDLPPGDASRPDVILVSIDSLRPDHLGSHGHTRDVSPFLDELAAGGRRFENAWAMSPWTLPSHVTMLSGRNPLEHNVIEDDRRIPGELPMVAESIRAAGYATGGFVSTVYVSARYGFDRGFDHYDDFGIAEGTNLKRQVHAERVIDEALAWARGTAGKPIFLFVHLYDVHYPYLPPEPYNYRYDKPGSKKSTRYRNYAFYKSNPLKPRQLEHQRAQYDECIRYVDDQLRRLSDALAAAGRKPTWVVTADHGEEFGERGSWGHAHTLHPEVMRVPMIVTGTTPAVLAERVGTLDVAATVARAAGASFSSGGVDLRGPIPAERDWPMETSRFDTAKLGLVRGTARLEVEGTAAVVFEWTHDPAERAPRPADPAWLTRAAAVLGTPWTATGPVTSPATLWNDLGPTGHQVDGATPFGLYPPDAPLLGPATRTPPLPPTLTLDDATREQLEALGYQQ